MKLYGANMTSAPSAPTAGHPHRWAVLAVAALAVFVVLMDGTIVNVAIPSLSTDLGASTRQLQWIVDAYLLVFTGLLLAAGGLGDRYGRKRALVLGLLAFAGTSVWAGSAGTASPWLARYSTRSSSPDQTGRPSRRARRAGDAAAHRAARAAGLMPAG